MDELDTHRSQVHVVTFFVEEQVTMPEPSGHSVKPFGCLVCLVFGPVKSAFHIIRPPSTQVNMVECRNISFLN